MQETVLQRRAEQNQIKREKEIYLDKKEAKVVFITGSSIGIGRETAFKFAEAGWKIIIGYYKDKKEAKKTAEKCKELGAEDVLVVKLNVMDNKSILNVIKEIIKKFNHINVLINNAGVVFWKELIDQEDEEIENQIRTNLEGLIKVTKYCLPYIKEVIINISSGAGKTGHATLTTYCASKFGVRGFTQALAQELKGIKVYSINPRRTKTRMTDFSGDAPEKVAEIIFNTAVGRYKVVSGGDVDVWEYL